MTTPKEALELKPCPFCGGKAKVIISRCAEDAEEASVRCEKCFCSTDHYEDAYAPRAQAVEAWNTRATSSLEGDAVDEAAIRADEREKCARELEASYPGHAWLNAACAAIRSGGGE